MRLFRFFQMDFKIDPLLLAIFAPAVVIGKWEPLLVAFLTVLGHEMAHVCAGRVLGVRTQSIELLPFGGVAYMDTPQTPVHEFLIALAGPVFNLCVVAVLMIFLRAYGLSARLSMWIQTNLVIGLFNLLPAMPLDGGRMVRALLLPLCGVERATRIVSVLGILGGMILAASGVTAFLSTGTVNITLLGVGAFMVFTAIREARGSMFAMAKRTQGKRDRLRKQPMEEHRMAADSHARAGEVIKRIPSGRYTCITVLGDQMQILGTLSENDLLEGILRRGKDTTLAKLLDQA